MTDETERPLTALERVLQRAHEMVAETEMIRDVVTPVLIAEYEMQDHPQAFVEAGALCLILASTHPEGARREALVARAVSFSRMAAGYLGSQTRDRVAEAAGLYLDGVGTPAEVLAAVLMSMTDPSRWEFVSEHGVAATPAQPLRKMVEDAMHFLVAAAPDEVVTKKGFGTGRYYLSNLTTYLSEAAEHAIRAYEGRDRGLVYELPFDPMMPMPKEPTNR